MESTEVFEGSDCAYMVVPVDNKISGQLPLPRLLLKRIRADKLEEENIASALEEHEAEPEGQPVKVESAPQESRTISVPKKKKKKKRRYVPLPADEISAKDISTVEEEQVLKQSVAVEEPLQPKPMSFDESEEKQQKQHQKHEQPKAALPQSSNAAASSSKTICACSEDGACAGTSTSGFLTLTNQDTSFEHGIWQEALKKYKVQIDNFTEEQNEILSRSFLAVMEKMALIKANSDRFKMIHNCFKCHFSISHRCLPLDYCRNLLENPNIIMPNRTIICICGFAFFHAHLKRDRAPSAVEKSYTDRLRLLSRRVSLRCQDCYSQVVMSNRTSNVCDCLIRWEDMTGENRQDFYNAVQSSLHYPPPDTQSLDDFSVCLNNCCLFFHRCSRKAKLPGAHSTSPG